MTSTDLQLFGRIVPFLRQAVQVFFSNKTQFGSFCLTTLKQAADSSYKLGALRHCNA